MYKRKDYPKVGDYVIINIEEIGDNAIKCKLEEYENFYGIIPIDELPSSRYRNNIRKGNKNIAVVLDVDPANRIATLSLKRINQNRVKMKIFEYRRERSAYNIIEIMSKNENIKEEELIDKIVNNIIYNNKKLYEVFMDTYINGKDVLLKYKINKNLANKLYEYIKKYFKVPKYRIDKKIFMYTIDYNGIEKIKEFLKNFENAGFKVIYLGGGQYNIKYETFSSKDAQEKEKIFNSILEEKKSNGLYIELIEND